MHAGSTLLSGRTGPIAVGHEGFILGQSRDSTPGHRCGESTLYTAGVRVDDDACLINRRNLAQCREGGQRFDGLQCEEWHTGSRPDFIGQTGFTRLFDASGSVGATIEGQDDKPCVHECIATLFFKHFSGRASVSMHKECSRNLTLTLT